MGQHGYLIWVPQLQRIVTATHAVFDETYFPARRYQQRLSDFYAALPADHDATAIEASLRDNAQATGVGHTSNVPGLGTDSAGEEEDVPGLIDTDNAGEEDDDDDIPGLLGSDSEGEDDDEDAENDDLATTSYKQFTASEPRQEETRPRDIEKHIEKHIESIGGALGGLMA